MDEEFQARATLQLGTCYAHTGLGRSSDQWEPLPHHLEKVELLAGEFALAFGAKSWGSLIGDWHDLGKYSEAFQAHLRTSDPDAGDEEGASRRVDHSTFGAQYAARMLTAHAGRIVAFCIAGHHGHPPDATSTEENAS